MKRIVTVCIVVVAFAALICVGQARRTPDLSPSTQNLYKALQANNVQAVSDAVAQGADVNARNEFGFTPLVWAIVNAKGTVCDS